MTCSCLAWTSCMTASESESTVISLFCSGVWSHLMDLQVLVLLSVLVAVDAPTGTFSSRDHLQQVRSDVIYRTCSTDSETNWKIRSGDLKQWKNTDETRFWRRSSSHTCTSSHSRTCFKQEAGSSWNFFPPCSSPPAFHYILLKGWHQSWTVWAVRHSPSVVQNKQTFSDFIF